MKENLDFPEFMIKIDDKKIDEKKNYYYVDFDFSSNKNFYDLSFFSVFFLKNNGEIYYLCPLILNNMKIQKSDIDFLKNLIENDELFISEKDQKFYENIIFFCDKIKEICKNPNDDILKLESILFTKFDYLNGNSLQG